MKLVMIEWRDAFSQDGWRRLTKFTGKRKAAAESTCYSIGWLAYDGDDFKTVVATVGGYEGACAMTIPTPTIMRVVEIPVPAVLVPALASVGSQVTSHPQEQTT